MGTTRSGPNNWPGKSEHRAAIIVLDLGCAVYETSPFTGVHDDDVAGRGQIRLQVVQGLPGRGVGEGERQLTGIGRAHVRSARRLMLTPSTTWLRGLGESSTGAGSVPALRT